MGADEPKTTAPLGGAEGPDSQIGLSLPRNLRRYARHYLARFDPVRNGRLAAGTRFEISQLLTHPRPKNEAIIRSLCRNAFLGNATTLCAVLGRYKMYVDSEDAGLSAHLLLDGYWEMWLTEAMVRFIRPGMVVADIGANLGYFTVLMGELVGPTGWVHAFEPNPAIAARLKRSVNLNIGQRQTTVHQIALSDQDGETSLFVPLLEPKNATIRGPGGDGAHIPITTRRLDSLAEIDHLDIIKIDVEGAEEATWRGMQGLLARGRPLTVFMEFTADRYENPQDFIDLILSHGFSLSLMTHDGRFLALDKQSLLALPREQDQMLMLRR